MHQQTPGDLYDWCHNGPWNITREGMVEYVVVYEFSDAPLKEAFEIEK